MAARRMPDDPVGINSVVGADVGTTSGATVAAGGGTGKEPDAPGSAVPTVGPSLVGVGGAAGVAAGRHPATTNTIKQTANPANLAHNSS